MREVRPESINHNRVYSSSTKMSRAAVLPMMVYLEREQKRAAVEASSS